MDVMRILQEGVSLLTMVSMPLLGGMLVAGLIVAVVQSITQIQEQGLAFAVKGIVAIAVILLLGGWMVEHLAGFLRFALRQALLLVGPGA